MSHKRTLYNRSEPEHPCVLCGSPDVTSTKSLPRIINTVRSFKRKIRRPVSRLVQQLHVNFCDVISLVNQLCAFSLVLLRLHLNPGSHFSASGTYAVINAAGVVWPIEIGAVDLRQFNAATSPPCRYQGFINVGSGEAISAGVSLHLLPRDPKDIFASGSVDSNTHPDR